MQLKHQYINEKILKKLSGGDGSFIIGMLFIIATIFVLTNSFVTPPAAPAPAGPNNGWGQPRISPGPYTPQYPSGLPSMHGPQNIAEMERQCVPHEAQIHNELLLGFNEPKLNENEKALA